MLQTGEDGRRRIFVTGAAGVVGSYVPAVFENDELVLTDLVPAPGIDELDVRDGETVARAIREAKPDVVLHLAAATDVDLCEKDPDLAYSVNAMGTENVAFACRRENARLVYVSTAGVFGGDKPEPYHEFDEPDPANVYGRSKLAGERTVASFLDEFFITRAGWMVGGGVKEKKFVGMMFSQIRGGSKHLRAVSDKVGSPTYAPDLLLGIRRLLDTEQYGLFHLVNSGTCSRYEVARTLCEILERPDIEVEPVSSAFFPLPAPRARSEAMRNLKLQLLGLPPIRPWQDALREYVEMELNQMNSASPAHVPNSSVL